MEDTISENKKRTDSTLVDIPAKAHESIPANNIPQKKLVNLPSVASNSEMSSAIIDGSSNQLGNNIAQNNNIDNNENNSHNNLIESGDYDGEHDNRGRKRTYTNISSQMDTSNINKQTKQGNEQVERRSTDRFGSENTLSKNQNKQGTYKIEEENIEGRNIKRVQITDEKVNDEIQNYSNDINPYNLSEVELIKDNVKEVVDERYSNKNIKYSISSTKYEQGYNDVNNESNRNRRTSKENVKVFGREQNDTKNRLFNQTQEGNNTQELSSSFSNEKNYRGSHQIAKKI